MAAKKKRARKRNPVTAELKDRLNLACDVIATVVDALSADEAAAAVTLLHHGLCPLLQVRDALERGS